jgi:hypothetical protein
MDPREVFDAWAPAGSVWADWVKPVVFAHLHGIEASTSPPSPEFETAWAPPADQRVALGLDLPAAAAVPVAAALAQRGYRPVPLYNAVPAPAGLEEVVDVRPIAVALITWAPALAQAPIPPDAPPVFMLDSERRVGRRPVAPRMFDNRSVSLTTDFPSAAFLKGQGIAKALLVQQAAWTPQADLAHTLRRWQDAQIGIWAIALANGAPPRQIAVSRPWWYRWGWQRWLATVGLRRHPLGGFGGELPEGGAG